MTNAGPNLRLKLLGAVYGRDKELEQLDTLYQKCLSGSAVVAIHGGAGSGKSSLIQAYVKRDSFESGVFVEAKFEKSRMSEPFSAIVDAVEFLVADLASKDLCQQTMRNFLKTIPHDASLLRKVIPKIFELANMSQEEQEYDVSIRGMKMEFSFDRLTLALRRLLLFICSPQRPVVMFLDDVQWVDRASLDFLQFLLVGSSGSFGCKMCKEGSQEIEPLKGLFLVMAYREEQISITHPLRVKFNELSAPMIHVKDLTLEQVNVLLANLLSKLPDETMPLANVILQKSKFTTGANIIPLRVPLNCPNS
jgi:predicted ATPase